MPVLSLDNRESQDTDWIRQMIGKYDGTYLI